MLIHAMAISECVFFLCTTCGGHRNTSGRLARCFPWTLINLRNVGSFGVIIASKSTQIVQINEIQPSISEFQRNLFMKKLASHDITTGIDHCLQRSQKGIRKEKWC